MMSWLKKKRKEASEDVGGCRELVVVVGGGPRRLTLQSAASSASNKEELDVKPETGVLEGLGVLCINEIMVRMISYSAREPGPPSSVVVGT